MPTIKYDRPKSISSSKEYLNQLSERRPLIVYVTATWCPPCRFIAPVVEKLSDENENAVIVKMDLDHWRDDISSNEDLDVSSVPTFFGFDGNGKKVDKFSGASKEKLQSMIKGLLEADGFVGVLTVTGQ